MRRASDDGTLTAMLLPPKAALGHLPDAQVPPELEKPFRNGVHLPFDRFPALAGTLAEQGEPACLWLGGELMAIGERVSDGMRIRSWLGD